MKPRLTNAVREGWSEIRAFITCELESGQASQFECKLAYEAIQNEEEPPDTETCKCEGCTAARNADLAITWIDSRMERA
jgi:hypothetical protein